MRIAFFRAKSYGQDSFDVFLKGSGHEITYFEVKLDKHIVYLAVKSLLSISLKTKK